MEVTTNFCYGLKKINPLFTRENGIWLNKLLQLEIEDYFMMLFFLCIKCTSNEYTKQVVILSSDYDFDLHNQQKGFSFHSDVLLYFSLKLPTGLAFFHDKVLSSYVATNAVSLQGWMDLSVSLVSHDLSLHYEKLWGIHILE